LEQGAQAMIEAGWDEEADEVLCDHRGDGFHVCDQWVKRAIGQGDWSIGDSIASMDPKDSVKGHVVVAFAGALSRAKKLKELSEWVTNHQDVLRGNTWCWGMIGHAFSFPNDDRGVVEWMHDWTNYPDAQPWMLINLALALRGLERVEEAR